MPFLALAIQDSFTYLLILSLILSSVGLLYVIYKQFLFPILSRKESDRFIPVQVGDKFDYVVDEISRNGQFLVGCRTGNLPTRCQAISEDHLIFQFKKARDTEDYTIHVLKNGSTFFRPPRMEIFEKMEQKESFESYEIIGHSTDFRISDKIVKDRMINFIELSLSSSFYFNKVGKERMRFTITVQKIQPGINRKLKSREDTYPFGKEEGEGEET